MPETIEQRLIKLGIEVDQQKIQRTQRVLKGLESDVQSLSAVESRSASASKLAADGLGKMGAEAASSVRDVKKRIDSLEEEIDLTVRLGDALDKEKRAREGASKARNDEQKSAFQLADEYNSELRRKAGALGDVDTALQAIGGASGIQGARLAGEVFAVAEAIPQLVGSLKAMPAAISATVSGLIGAEVAFSTIALTLLPIAASVAAVALAFKKFQKDLEEQKATLNSALDAQRSYFELIQSGTSGEIRDARDAEIERQQAIRDTIAAQQEVFDGLSQIEKLSPAGKALKDNIKALTEELNGAEFQINAYNQALSSQQVIARDLAQTQSEALARTITTLDEMTQRRLQAEELGLSSTSESIDARIAAYQRESAAIDEQIAQLQPLSETSAEASDEIQRLVDRQHTLAMETAALSEVTIPLIAQREAEAAVLERQAHLDERRKEMLEKTAAIEQSRLAYLQDLSDAEEEVGEKRKALLDQFEEKIGDVGTKLAQSISGLARDMLREQDKSSRKLQDDIEASGQELRDTEYELRKESLYKLVELQGRYNREIASIESDTKDSLINAQLDRDARAQGAAEREQNRRLKDAEDQLEQGVEQEQDALDQQIKEARRANEIKIRDLKTSFQQERRERLIANREKLDDLRQAAKAELQLLYNQRTEQIVALEKQGRDEAHLRDEQYAEQLRQLGAHNIQLSQINKEGLAAVSKQWAEFYRSMAKQLAGTTERTWKGDSAGWSVGEFASGGTVPRTGIAKVHSGELAFLPGGTRIFNSSQTERLLGQLASGRGITVSAPVTINTNATDARGVMHEIEMRFPALLERAIEGALA
jgi:hypothetical protein